MPNEPQGGGAHDGGGDLSGDVLAFLYEDLARTEDRGTGPGAVEEFRLRCAEAGRIIRRVGFDRALPYLEKLREYRKVLDVICEVPEATLDP